MDKRILELAIEALQGRRVAVAAEIDWIRTQLKGGVKAKGPATAAPAAGRRKARTAAQRKAQSEKMRAYWAAKRKTGTKTKAAKRPASAKPAKGPVSPAARKAQSERMKAYWAKKRKEKQSKPAA
ncbi:MAG: hypothetical protein LAP85_09380 [Acidobacteriia bacterium]|nr:hypothetical protein [Terriglobia bacterium]